VPAALLGVLPTPPPPPPPPPLLLLSCLPPPLSSPPPEDQARDSVGTAAALRPGSSPDSRRSIAGNLTAPRTTQYCWAETTEEARLFA
jgi:hypothetical protein